MTSLLTGTASWVKNFLASASTAIVSSSPFSPKNDDDDTVYAIRKSPRLEAPAIFLSKKDAEQFLCRNTTDGAALSSSLEEEQEEEQQVEFHLFRHVHDAASYLLLKSNVPAVPLGDPDGERPAKRARTSKEDSDDSSAVVAVAVAVAVEVADPTKEVATNKENNSTVPDRKRPASKISTSRDQSPGAVEQNEASDAGVAPTTASTIQYTSESFQSTTEEVITAPMHKETSANGSGDTVQQTGESVVSESVNTVNTPPSPSKNNGDEVTGFSPKKECTSDSTTAQNVAAALKTAKPSMNTSSSEKSAVSSTESPETVSSLQAVNTTRATAASTTTKKTANTRKGSDTSDGKTGSVSLSSPVSPDYTTVLVTASKGRLRIKLTPKLEVYQVFASSPLFGKLLKGDTLVKIDGVIVTHWTLDDVVKHFTATRTCTWRVLELKRSKTSNNSATDDNQNENASLSNASTETKVIISDNKDTREATSGSTTGNTPVVTSATIPPEPAQQSCANNKGTSNPKASVADEVALVSTSSSRSQSAIVDVIAPKGRLGVEITPGPVVGNVFPSSPMFGKIFKGDKLVEINDVNVEKWELSGVVKYLSNIANQERTLRISRSSSSTHRQDEDGSSLMENSASPDGKTKPSGTLESKGAASTTETTIGNTVDGKAPSSRATPQGTIEEASNTNVSTAQSAAIPVAAWLSQSVNAPRGYKIVQITAPKGILGFDFNHNMVVRNVMPLSPLYGIIMPEDTLVQIDMINLQNWRWGDVLRYLSTNAHRERILFVCRGAGEYRGTGVYRGTFW
jgi:hypothetical protein